MAAKRRGNPVSPRARAWPWLPHVHPRIVLAVSFEPLSRYTCRCGPATCPMTVPDQDSSKRGATFWRRIPLSTYDRPGIGRSRQRQAGEGTLMVLRSHLACVAEITGSRSGLPGFLVGG